MLVTLLLILLGFVLFDTRRRLKLMEHRLHLLEAAGPRAEAYPSALEEPEPIEREPVVTAPRRAAAVMVRTPSPESVVMPEPRPVAVREPQDEPHPVDPVGAPSRKGGIAFEELFGRRLPIWAGGITLAVAGVLLVKYSIDSGLLSPIIRVLIGLLFGGGLIAGAEVALRQEQRLRDPRVRQSLAGAGIATLYAVILAAANLYHLVGPATAFVGLAAVTGLAMALSLRFGAPSALLGLVGGLAAPALAGSTEPNVPLLSCYLALIIGGLGALSRTQRWMWLGVGALVGGAGWGSLLILTGALDLAASLSVGLLILAIGIAFPLLAFSGSRATPLRAISAVVASAQMAALVATGGFALLHWALFGLLSIAFLWLSGREPALRRLVPVGLAVALLLAGAWPSPAVLPFTVVILVTAAIYGGTALWRIWRPGGSLIEAGQVAAVSLAGLAVSALHFHRGSADDLRFALIAAAAAALPAIAMLLGWRETTRRADARFSVLATSVAILLAIAGFFGFTGWTWPIVVALAAAGLLLLAELADDRRVEWSGWAFAFISLAMLVSGDRGLSELGRLAGEGGGAPSATALLRWGTVAAVAILYAWRARFAEGRLVAQVPAALTLYGAIAQMAPMPWLAPIAALSLSILAEAARRLPQRSLLPAMGAMLCLTLLWAAQPLMLWSGHALLSLLGEPMLTRELPTVGDVIRCLALPAALVWLASVRGSQVIGSIARRIAFGVSILLGAVAAHVLYKQLFGLTDSVDFIRFGLAERTLWQAALLGMGWAIWRFAARPTVALAFVGAALAHSILYTLLLHNPLWASQAVGGVPLLSLILPAFALPLVALWLGSHIAPDLSTRFVRPIDGARMILILLFALAMLRQLFEGSMLNLPHLSAGEDIGRSVLAIGLALGFLLWGIRHSARDWRVASLLLMLAAVAKVFLLDASGLTGLLRIASFLALGFSLIGIGWLYSRHLRADGD